MTPLLLHCCRCSLARQCRAGCHRKSAWEVTAVRSPGPRPHRCPAACPTPVLRRLHNRPAAAAAGLEPLMPTCTQHCCQLSGCRHLLTDFQAVLKLAVDCTGGTAGQGSKTNKNNTTVDPNHWRGGGQAGGSDEEHLQLTEQAQSARQAGQAGGWACQLSGGGAPCPSSSSVNLR